MFVEMRLFLIIVWCKGAARRTDWVRQFLAIGYATYSMAYVTVDFVAVNAASQLVIEIMLSQGF
jgi:hypothetical protein